MTNDFGQQTRLEVFRQHWEQVRHNQYQRLAFTSFYALVVIGFLAFISQRGEGDFRILFWVLCGLSLFGIFFCLRLKHSIEGHSNIARSLAGELTNESKCLEKYIPFWKQDEKWCDKLVSLRVLFPTLYVVGAVFFLLLAIGLIHII